MKKILIVEDEKHIAEGIKFNLLKQGHAIDVIHSGKRAIDMWQEIAPDLIILDLMLPEVDGFKVLEHIRLHDERLPIIILSARTAVQDKVRCFKKGVDDYLAKPFDLDELILRVERNLKRSDWVEDKEHSPLKLDFYEFSSFTIDFKNQKATTGKSEVELTLQELKLLRVFFENEGKILSRKFLLENAFGYSVNASSRTVDNFIVRLRKYFERDPKKPLHFLSKRSQGYIFSSKAL